MKVALIFGTRPEIIKLSPLVRLFERKRIPYFMIHSGQHYSYEMDRLFFKELHLPEPHYRLNIRSKGVMMQADHTGRMLIEIEKILLKEMPRFVLVQGDTNTVLAGALTVAKFLTTELYTHIHMFIGHVEAGLRSYDRHMPEEINRFISDHLSHLCFAPTKKARATLIGEDVPRERVYVTGNTIVDAVRENLVLARRKSGILRTLGLEKGEYFLMTLHRQENVDDERCLRRILEGVGRVGRRFGRPVIFPIHPRTAKKLEKFKLSVPRCVRRVDPVGFLDFLLLESAAALALTDSGGVQEETCILRVPCVTLRTTTERPETVEVGANIVAGHDPVRILASARKMLARKRNWPNPFGDGRTSERIWRILRTFKR